MARGIVAAVVCAWLSLLGHAEAGGALPNLGLLAVLTLPLGGLLVALADRKRGPATILAITGGTQLALHWLLQTFGELDGRHNPPGGHAHGDPALVSLASMAQPDPMLMTGAHALVTVLTASVLTGAEWAVFLVAAVLVRVLPLPPPTLPAPPLFGGVPKPLEARDARPRGALGRRLCPRRGPPLPCAG